MANSTERCPRCDRAVQPADRFCASCGSRIATDTPQRKAVADTGEHRQLTIVFSDMVGSTALTERLGAETFRELVREYRDRAAEACDKYGGQIARTFGDGLLIYFGYPRANEGDARRAVQASLELQSAMAELSPRWEAMRDARVRLRIAVHTGQVVAGDITSGLLTEHLAVIGDAPNVAARLQELAEPGSVTISEATYRLVEHAFACTPLGEHALKGVSRPLAIYRVDGPLRSNAALDRRRHRTPLVGRTAELETLLSAWHRASRGHAEVVMIEAEAGMGKSRLIAEMLAATDPRMCRRSLLQCSSLSGNTALYPVCDYLRTAFRLEPTQDPAAWLDQLRDGFAAQKLDGEEYAARLAPLLGLAPPPAWRPPAASPQQERELLLRRLVEWLLHEAELRPVLVVLEDLHWADPSTLELLVKAVAAAGGRQVLFVLSSRNPVPLAWPKGIPITTIRLGRLPEADSRRLIGLIAPAAALTGRAIAALQRRADGIPLFLEELTSAAVGAAVGAVDGPAVAHSLPATLRESLTARIDRAAVDRDVLHLCATFGREFEIDLLRAVWPGDPDRLERELDKLLRADLLLGTAWTGTTRYTFRHALIQEAVYGFQLLPQRQQNHARIARAFLEHFPGMAESSPEIIASHFIEAGDEAAGLPLLQRAASLALGRSAIPEAAHHLRRALALVRALPASEAAMLLELRLLSSLGVALSAHHGFASEEAGKVFGEALTICRRLGRLLELFPALHGLYRYYFNRGQPGTAADLSREMLAIARRQRDPALLLEAHRAAGNCRFLAAEFGKAIAHFRATLRHYDTTAHAQHRVLYGTDPFVVASTMAALCGQLAGETGAGQEIEAAIRHAVAIEHPYSLCWALAIGSVVFEIGGEPDRVRELAARQLEVARQHEFALWQLSAGIFLRWSAAIHEDDAAAIAPMRRGIDQWLQAGSTVYSPYFMGLLAAAHLHHGDTAACEAVLDAAIESAVATGERWCMTGLERLRAVPGAARNPALASIGAIIAL